MTSKYYLSYFVLFSFVFNYLVLNIKSENDNFLFMFIHYFLKLSAGYGLIPVDIIPVVITGTVFYYRNC